MFNLTIADVPEKTPDLVNGMYDLEAPKGETTVAVNIIDMLDREWSFDAAERAADQFGGPRCRLLTWPTMAYSSHFETEGNWRMPSTAGREGRRRSTFTEHQEACWRGGFWTKRRGCRMCG